MSDSELSDSHIPSREECEARCTEFATVTGTDSACAMYYLQDRDWDLQKSLNSYFEDNGGSAPQLGDKCTTDGACVLTTNATYSTETVMKEPSSLAPHLKLLSWNIDGLDSNNIINRTKGVCNQIKQDKPDVVFLQEVVPNSQTVLEDLCPTYQLIPGGSHGYYTAVMIGCEHSTVESQKVTRFHSSTMSRNLLIVKAVVRNVQLTLMTSHLESQKAHAKERKGQLKVCLDAMMGADAERGVLFAGDLNLRDTELTDIGGLPDGVVDVWQETGQRPEAKFTWDLQKNDNLDWQFPNKPRCRFDRMYYRPSTASSSKPKLKPVYFELAGIQRLKCCKRFPSDHWGILAHFDITDL